MNLCASFFPGHLNEAGGDSARIACFQAAALASRGFHVLVDGLYTRNLPIALEQFSLGCCDLRTHLAEGSGPTMGSTTLIDSVERRTRKRQFDIAHLYGHRDPINYQIASICRKAGIPYVVSASESLLPVGSVAGIEADWDQDWVTTAEEKYIQGAEAIHFTSHFEKDHSQFLGGLARRTLVIPGAVDLEHLAEIPDRQESRSRLCIAEDCFAMLFLGNLQPEGTPEFLLRILTELNLDCSPILFLVGTASDDAQVRIMRKADELGVMDRVTLVTDGEKSERGNWLAAADVFLSPSPEKSFSLDLIESVASGLPTIVSCDGGVTKFLEDQEYDAISLVPEQWARRCEEIARQLPKRNPGSLAQLIEYFSPARIVERWLEFYEKRLPERSSRLSKPMGKPLTRQVLLWAKARAGEAGLSKNLTIQEMNGGASARSFFRLFDDQDGTAVVMVFPSRKGDYTSSPYNSSNPLAWFDIGRFLKKLGLPVPAIYSFDLDRDWLLIEDFGAKTLEDELLISDSARRHQLHEKAIDLLIEIQARSTDILGGTRPATRVFDESTLKWEFFHFVEWGLEKANEAVITAQDRILLLREFSRLSRELAEARLVLTHRDYQARNLMVRSGDSLGLLDFDDALMGNPAYDLASLLLDCHRPVDWDFLDVAIEMFFERSVAVGHKIGTRSSFRRLFEIQGIQRSLKAAGRFVWIAEEMGKREYLLSVNRCIEFARDLMDRHQDLDDLRNCLGKYEKLFLRS